ncbi:PREDICTED: uncharacterized protein At4g02000-like [Camelina sativa]|uniref:Uncharacterized protein At4g02000-like n=1 Tax=Camelina sativa TaxID=90675 RepID=A0ABM0T002_CAMSA|nr:PREDICTED: uncharacterized protein At4g02000-like [Camelina sativa]
MLKPALDLWVQVRGIPLPYVSETTVRFIANNTLGEVVELDFNEETSTQIAFIRLKIRIGISDRLRFFRRVRFESGEGAMIGFEYEKLIRICTNCCRINHDSNHFPYLAPPIVHEDCLEVPIFPAREESEGSDLRRVPEAPQLEQSSELSSYSPISQPPRPVHPAPSLEEFLAAHHLHRGPSSSSRSLKESSDSRKAKGKLELGESSKRRKGKQIQVEPVRNTRQCRKDPGVRFYPVNPEPP